jgi:hypothetical protein
MARTEVKVVLESGEVKFFEYASVDLAIVALGKLVKIPAPKVDPRQGQLPLGAAPETAGARQPDRGTASGGSTLTPAPDAAPARQRKPRADKGVPRGPYNKGGEQPATPEPKAGGEQNAATNGDSATGSAALAPAPLSQQPDAGTASTGGGAGPAAPAAAVSDAQVQAACDKLFAATKSLPVCMAVFSRFGAKRGRDIPADLRGEFLAKVERVIAGEAP